MEKLPDQLFRDLLDWYMCSDPWPVCKRGTPRLTDAEHAQRITAFMEEQSKLHGFDNWVVAYHQHMKQ